MFPDILSRSVQFHVPFEALLHLAEPNFHFSDQKNREESKSLSVFNRVHCEKRQVITVLLNWDRNAEFSPQMDPKKGRYWGAYLPHHRGMHCFWLRNRQWHHISLASVNATLSYHSLLQLLTNIAKQHSSHSLLWLCLQSPALLWICVDLIIYKQLMKLVLPGTHEKMRREAVRNDRLIKNVIPFLFPDKDSILEFLTDSRLYYRRCLYSATRKMAAFITHAGCNVLYLT